MPPTHEEHEAVPPDQRAPTGANPFPSPPEDASADGAPARVLVVDDEPDLRAVLCRLLEREGLEVRVAGNGTAALEMLVEAAPDVILLDVQMPGPSGFEVCATIKGNPETRFIPVILITGLGRVEDRIRGIEVGADDFIVKPFDRHEVVARVRSLSRVKRATDGLERAELVLLALARSIEGRDPYTQGHCERLSRYATALGDRLGLPTPELVALERAGTTHDIGKVAVPDAILLKKGPLTDEEWTVMRQHPVTGEHICKPIKSFKLVRPIIRHHHERLDGSGYPDGLMGDNIPLTARVLSVVDVFDALTTRRSYKHAMRTDDALEVMATEGRKGWLDREIVPEFRDLVLQGGLLDAVTAGNPA